MNQIVKSKGIYFGIVLGAVLSFLTAGIYAIDISSLLNPWLQGVIFLLVILLGILAISSVKKIFNGFIGFKDAFSTFFVVIVIGFLISTLVGFLIFNVIDPEAKDVLKQLSIEKVTELMERFNVPEDALDEAIAKVEETDSFSLVSQIKNYFMTLAMYSIIGLIVAAIMKKKNPEL